MVQSRLSVKFSIFKILFVKKNYLKTLLFVRISDDLSKRATEIQTVWVFFFKQDGFRTDMYCISDFGCTILRSQCKYCIKTCWLVHMMVFMYSFFLRAGHLGDEESCTVVWNIKSITLSVWKPELYGFKTFNSFTVSDWNHFQIFIKCSGSKCSETPKSGLFQIWDSWLVLHYWSQLSENQTQLA